MTSDNSNRRVYYSKVRAAAFLSLAVLVVFVAVVAAAGATGTGGQVGAIVAGCIAAALLLRWAACAVIADGDGVTVRNPLRTYRFAYDQIAHVSTVGYTGNSPATQSIVAIKLRDGRTIKASALIVYVAGRWRTKRPPNPVINDLLGRAHGAGSHGAG